ncbi:DEAD-box ATP-dependent RNA helicase CshA [hydrothermal vent metagenome]|uniref:RNA helicase n=1 Tax=hydrothermal vent metagenome TaxID=652676 RepID=A0A1W1EL36_9ZZZZ
MKFTDFNFKSTIQEAIEQAGFKEPSPIQKDAIPHILEGKDVIAQAHTGTGKTAAFGLPVLNMMKADGNIEAVVIVPTRELAMQVSDELYKFGKLSKINTATVYGGTPYGKQIERINRANIIVATPGRLQDLLKSGKIKINPNFVILDEADEMLDMGFLDEIKNIFTFFKKDRQTLMFSATMPNAIKRLAQDILIEPITITITKKDSTNKNISQNYYVMAESERDDALIRLIDYKNPAKAIVFCRMKREVDRLVTHLVASGFKAKGLHGDMEQRQREVVIRAFKQGQVDIFVATDVAARGLDVNDVSHVFNYHIPFDSESYVHRIGRTGRAGNIGEAITLITPNELKALQKIEKDVGAKIITQEIPTKDELVNSQQDQLITQILEAKENDSSYEIIKKLTSSLDITSIAYKLLSLLQAQNKVMGKNVIGMNLREIEELIKRKANERPSNGGGRNRRGRGGNRNRSRNGNSGNRNGNRNRNRSRNSNRD